MSRNEVTVAPAHGLAVLVVLFLRRRLMILLGLALAVQSALEGPSMRALSAGSCC